jgi:hypothetical protein
VVLVARVGAATGSQAVAAALACAGSELDSAALLVDLDDGHAPRSTLVATVGARALEQRLVVHLPDAAVASRGQICHLKLPPGPEGIAAIAATLPLVRESAAAIHLAPHLLRAVLEEPRIRPTSVLLRADLSQDRALTALAVRDLMARGLHVAVLKRPPGWRAARAALFGALSESGQALPAGLRTRLLATDSQRARFRRP